VHTVKCVGLSMCMDMERERGGGACGVGPLEQVSTCSDTAVPHREASIEPVNESNMHPPPPNTQTTTMY
jgi:hypothetical protein